MMIGTLLSYYVGNPSYVENLGNSYFVLSFSLLALAVAMLVLDPDYFRVIIAKLTHYPGPRSREKRIESLSRVAKLSSQVLFTGSLALIILMIMKPYDYLSEHSSNFMNWNNYVIWFILITVLLIIYNIKWLHYIFDNWLTLDKLNIALWGQNILNVNFLSAFILIPICIAYALGHLSTTALINLLILCGIANLVLRGVTTLPLWSSYDSSKKINFFLYFCTFEILPLLILIKFVRDAIY